MKTITWYLTGHRYITKRGLGTQQVFATLSREERMDITMNCVRCVVSA